MHRPWALGWMVIGVLAAPAHAQVTEIYKCLDPAGRPLYTSDKRDTAGKKCELVSREINVVPAQQIPVQRPSAARSGSGRHGGGGARRRLCRALCQSRG